MKGVVLPEGISNRNCFKRKYTLKDMYLTFMKVPGAIRTFMQNRKTGAVDPLFIERLQLAVTEVNGCAVCSYAHTAMALRLGMSNMKFPGF